MRKEIEKSFDEELNDEMIAGEALRERVRGDKRFARLRAQRKENDE